MPEASRESGTPRHVRRFSVQIVSADRSLLRQLARFLDEFGFDARAVADAGQAAAALEGQRPDFLIVDAELPGNSGLELCRAFCGHDQTGYVYTLLLAGKADAEELLEAFSAGVDDFLARPLVHGEVLARLRAGARVLEFERRAREQSRHDAVCGLPARGALEDHLRRRINSAAAERRSVSLVVVDLDGFGRVDQSHGRPAADALLRQVAERLQGTLAAPRQLYSLGGGRFAALLDAAQADDAVRWAEEARARLKEQPFAIGGASVTLSASFGVAACPNGEHTAEELLQEAWEAVDTAKNSGRDCVVRYGQFTDELKRWRELAAPGRMFELTTARDVMTPCAVTLRPEDAAGLASSLLARTRLPAIPVVDGNGKMLGLVAQPDPTGSGSRQRTPATVGEMLSTDTPRFEEEATFGELVDLFIREERPLVVVVRDGRPQGLVLRATLAALIEPVSAEQFAPRGPYRGDSEYLIVADPATVE